MGIRDGTASLMRAHFCRDAAEYVLPLLDKSRHQGVCYFEPRSSPPTWMILESRGRCLPLASAPVKERDTFAIFDDARCRGADLKVSSFGSLA